MTLKRWHWIVIVLVTAGLVVMAPSDDGQVAKKGGRSDKTTPKATTGSVAPTSTSFDRQPGIEGGRVELELLSKLETLHSQKDRVSDVFNQTTWYVPPPPPPSIIGAATASTPATCTCCTAIAVHVFRSLWGF